MSETNIPQAEKNKIVAEANWRSTNGHGGVDDITRDNFILAAEYGYSLASKSIDEKDEECHKFEMQALNNRREAEGLKIQLSKQASTIASLEAENEKLIMLTRKLMIGGS